MNNPGQSVGGNNEKVGSLLDQNDRLAPEPNIFYQEKVLQYLLGQQGVFRDPNLQPTTLDPTAKNELIKGIALKRYDEAFQRMLVNDMGTIKGMTADQMRQVCTDQIELLRQDGHKRLVNDRFRDTEAAIHQTLQPLYAVPSQQSTAAAEVAPAMRPLPADGSSLPKTRETVVDPELETRLSLQQFLEAQKILLTSKRAALPSDASQKIFQTDARINLVKKALTTLQRGQPFSPQDAKLLIFVIDETKNSESHRLALAQSKVGNDNDQRTIARSVQQLWQMQKYIEQHQEKAAA